MPAKQREYSLLLPVRVLPTVMVGARTVGRSALLRSPQLVTVCGISAFRALVTELTRTTLVADLVDVKCSM
jgi:hypothetical protein